MEGKDCLILNIEVLFILKQLKKGGLGK